MNSVDLIGSIARDIMPDDEALSRWFSAYAAAHRRRLAFDLDLLSRYAPPGAKIAEIGSVPPLLTIAAARAGYDVTGFDIAPERFGASLRANDVEVRLCDIEREALSAADGSFDIVIFNEIFEHLRINLICTMDEVRRVLRPDGLLLLSTPNLRSLHGIVNLVFRGRGVAVGELPRDEWEKLARLGHMGHVREYTPLEVRDFLSRSGFRVSETIFRNATRHPVARAVTWLVPGLRPFMTFVAHRNRHAKT